MSTGLRELLDEDLEAALEQLLTPRLAELIHERQPGHCMRVSDLDTSLAVRLCRRLRSVVGDGAQVYVLGEPPDVPADVAVSSTKLVELRNPDARGEHRAPLLAFVPPGTHTSAEDSFGVATFEEVDLGDVYADLVARHIATLSTEMRPSIEDLFAVLDDERWPYGDTLARARYLLTVQLNDQDPAAAGAAIFELGLIPDFELFTRPDEVRTRVTRNLQQVEILTEPSYPDRQRVIKLGLVDPNFRSRFAEFVAQTGLETPREWTRRIVVDRANWPLAFHRWPLREEASGDITLRIEVDDLTLPRAGDEPQDHQNAVLQNIAGQLYLPVGAQGLSQLDVSFRVDPDPRQVKGLAKFAVQLVSEESGFTGVLTTVRVSKKAKTTYKATLKKLRTANLEQGWHFIRVLPQDVEGIPLPVEEAQTGLRPPNESDRFFVLPDGEVEVAPQSRARKDVGITQALRRLEFAALADGRDWRGVRCRAVHWKGQQGTGRHTLEAVFGGHGTVEIPLAPALAQLERGILAHPDRITRWRLSIRADRVDDPVCDPLPWPEVRAHAVETFTRARHAALDAIRGDDGMVVEGRDLLSLRTVARDYAEAYGELLTWQLRRAERADGDQLPGLLGELAAMLQLDTIHIDHVDPQGTRSEVVLTAPTHPLRLLWLVTWAEMGRRWLEDCAESEPETIIAAGQTLLDGLTPLGFPLVVPRSDGRLAVAVHDLTPYWGVCLPNEISDPQGLLGALSTALRLPERWISAQGISGRSLADRIERYLRLHPYVSTLVINAINAGRADYLADTLVELQRRKGLGEIKYDIRLFVRDSETSGAGEALAELLRGEWSSVAEAEAFHTPTASGLIPKLSVAVLPISEFKSASSQHAAHITLLFDALGGERFGTAPSDETNPVPVYGLLQGMTVTYTEDEDTVSWHKQPRHGPAYPLSGAEELSDLLSSLPVTVSEAAAAVTTGQVGTGQVPRISLTLDADDRMLLYQAHRSSDWVITVDRTFGVEFFDSPGSPERPEYVIDYDPEASERLGHHMVISSRSVDELRLLLAPAVTQHGLQIDQRHVGTFFDQLRLLSGRLAFKLASAALTQRTEVLGLALARLYLDYQGALADQILVPLDAHLELYREARKRSDEVGETVGLQRTDLALFGIDAKRRTITCRLVEVKCYSTLTDLSAYQSLKERIAEQLNRSQDVLAGHFDPHRVKPDRPDRPVKNAELAALLQYYLERAVRHGIMRGDAAKEAQWLLRRLDKGYRLEFTRTGLIFDLAGKGAYTETEAAIEYHRIGRDLVQELLDAIPTDPVLVRQDGETTTSRTSATLAHLDLTLPRLPNAAFRAPARSHELPEEEACESGEEPEAVEEPSAFITPDSHPESVIVAEEVPEPETTTPTSVADNSAHVMQEETTAAEPLVSTSIEPAIRAEIVPDVFLGTTRPSPQYGILGEVAGRRIALDLNETHTISLFGVQGGGKSYTLGSIMEMASLPAPPINLLPRPLATIVFHYSPTQDYAPEFTSMVAPNDDAEQIRSLQERYGAEPKALSDVVMLVPEDQLAERRSEYPDIQVLPLKFGSVELRAEHWRFLMGAVGNQSTYIRQLQRIMRAHRNDLRLDVIRQGVDDSSLPDHLKQLAHQRLVLASDYIDDNVCIKDLVRPGRMIIVDLRDEFIEKDEALGLFVVLMQLFAEAQDQGKRFNKLVVFDEAHKYIDSPDLVAGLVETVREMRHKGISVLVASQDPPSVPISLIELSNHIILHKFTSPAWLKHLQKANAALAELTPAKMASLAPGEAYVWSSRTTDPAFTRGAVKIRCRPRITRHGGSTKTAVEG